MFQCWLCGVCVNNPLSAKIPNPHLSYNCICSCFGDLQDYFSTGTTLHPQQLLNTGSTVAIAISGQGGKNGEKQRERKEEEKVFTVDREITGFIIFSQLILSITNDRAVAGTVKELVFVFER